MKADRLVSILMLLQIHKQLTANELAQRLEVSVRTIYRDVESLSSLGIPIFCDRGAKGGVKLLGDYKTSLSGMNTNEIYSLFIPSSNKVLEDLGIEKVKDSTILKLMGNSSPEQIKEIENIQNYIYIDMNTWSENPAQVDKVIISVLQNAIWNSTIVKIMYRKPKEIKEVILKPLGLVCKRGTWYLIGLNADIIKTYKISSIEDAILTDEKFERPTDFNLETHWKTSTSKFKSSIPKYNFTFKVNGSIIDKIKARQFITIKKQVVEEGIIYVDIDFDDIWQGIEFAFTYGSDIEIISPKEAIKNIKRNAYDIISLYK